MKGVKGFKMKEEIIHDVLVRHKFDKTYVKYSSFKYKIFIEGMRQSHPNDYSKICSDHGIYFSSKEEKALFAILKVLKWKIHGVKNYYFNRFNG